MVPTALYNLILATGAIYSPCRQSSPEPEITTSTKQPTTTSTTQEPTTTSTTQEPTTTSTTQEPTTTSTTQEPTTTSTTQEPTTTSTTEDPTTTSTTQEPTTTSTTQEPTTTSTTQEPTTTSTTQEPTTTSTTQEPTTTSTTQEPTTTSTTQEPTTTSTTQEPTTTSTTQEPTTTSTTQEPTTSTTEEPTTAKGTTVTPEPIEMPEVTLPPIPEIKPKQKSDVIVACKDQESLLGIVAEAFYFDGEPLRQTTCVPYGGDIYANKDLTLTKDIEPEEEFKCPDGFLIFNMTWHVEDRLLKKFDVSCRELKADCIKKGEKKDVENSSVSMECENKSAMSSFKAKKKSELDYVVSSICQVLDVTCIVPKVVPPNFG
ncbi:paternally-expressed gene 3 protein-like [Parasteatoda tepidariorum]|uniref:paternally-expressed gene 3 protein-like n=1 Tax=Parasteatoda tepidariorum TaxID=114398 RepID=UPI0039BD1A45